MAVPSYGHLKNTTGLTPVPARAFLKASAMKKVTVKVDVKVDLAACLRVVAWIVLFIVT